MKTSTRNRPTKRHLLLTMAVAWALGTGLVLAAQDSGRAERFADPSDRERRPLWVPGEDIPMAIYLRSEVNVPLAPPR